MAEETEETEERAAATAPSNGLGGGETTPPPDPNTTATATPPPHPNAAASNGWEITPATGPEAPATAAAGGRESNQPPEGVDHQALHEYAARYSGRTLVGRLIFIARRCSAESTELEALRLALEETKKGTDTKTYGAICQMINGRFAPTYDQAWVDEVQSNYNQSLLFIKADLKSYEADQHTDMIGKGYIELGDLYYSHGYLEQAFEAYAQSEQYIASSDHQAEIYLKAIVVDIELGNFDRILQCVGLAEAILNDHDGVTVAKLHSAAGLAHLRLGKYKLAALQFLKVGPELGSTFSELIAPQDIGIYGALCALTTFTAIEIKNSVLDNPNFGYFLGLVPDALELVNNFYGSNHTSCVQFLEKLRSNLKLDGHMAQHLDTLCLVIAQKSEYVSFDVFQLDTFLAPTPVQNEKDNAEPDANVISNLILPDNFNVDADLPISDHYKFVKCKHLLDSIGKRSPKWVTNTQACALLVNAEMFVVNSVDSEGREKRVDGQSVLVSDEKFRLIEVRYGSYTTTGRVLKEKQLQDKEDSIIDRFEMKGDKWARRRIYLRDNPGFHLLQWRKTSALRRVQAEVLEAPPGNTNETTLKELNVTMKALIDQLQATSKTMTDSSQDIAKSRQDIVEACSAAVTAMRGGGAN